MVKVKFCGIRRTEDIEAVNRLKPDLAGFVFAKSKRQVTKEQAAALKELLDPGIKTVAVLVNMPVEEAAALANTGIADLLQLHGDEDAAYIAKLKTLTGAKIIKAIRLRNGEPEANAKLLTEAVQADYYLFDTFLPDTYGGTGKTFSLSLLNNLLIDKPFFLAGGLDADNVAEIIGQVQKDETLRPNFYGVDVSGGIETDGYKDTVKMEAFMKAIRG
ncbi:phosphoribosylanthranilate isomerase [Succiniclasticum ruminis]|uniref:N-(5'-phosphoribosyl)anthranilate isomerase n=1 Tax=Succiniclasticum ruminis TaxID=40841 RepID=A0A1G6L754_9FIRM|nr:phosphoribosylanthranilate isomerase [Succiniclasticum ruminis]SDC38987.1 phosphoribosylanthranilate isomerase [Succiniclasticum ruminis]